MRKAKTIEIIAVVICMVFATAISLFHLSDKNDLGLAKSTWNTIWVISENGLMMSLCFLLGAHFEGVIRSLFWYLWIPYFILKMYYHIICYKGIWIFTPETWTSMWTLELMLFPLAIMVCVAIYVYTENVRRS